MSGRQKRSGTHEESGQKQPSKHVCGKNEKDLAYRKAVITTGGIIIVILLLISVICWRSCGDSSTNGSDATQADGSSALRGGTNAGNSENSDSDDGNSGDSNDAAGSGGTDSEDGNSGTGSENENSGADSSDGTNGGDSTSGTTEKATLPEIQNTASLTLSSVYTSSILNPDSGGVYAEEIASLEVTNSSDRYLVSAVLTGTMSDGTEVRFEVYDLPAGAVAEVFDTRNQTLDADASCTSLVCTSEEYLDADEDVLMTGTVQVTASGEDAVLTNTGNTALTNLTVVYHCDMAGQYFGGASCSITIDNLAAGESYTLSDSALMGGVAVVRIYQ